MRKVPTQLSACWLEVYCHHHQDTGTKNDTLSFVAVIPRDSNLLWWRIYRYLGFVKNNKSIIRVVCCFLPISSSTTIYIYIYIYISLLYPSSSSLQEPCSVSFPVSRRRKKRRRILSEPKITIHRKVLPQKARKKSDGIDTYTVRSVWIYQLYYIFCEESEREIGLDWKLCKSNWNETKRNKTKQNKSTGIETTQHNTTQYNTWWILINVPTLPFFLVRSHTQGGFISGVSTRRRQHHCHCYCRYYYY